jgi:hypothetical protein
LDKLRLDVEHSTGEGKRAKDPGRRKAELPEVKDFDGKAFDC